MKSFLLLTGAAISLNIGLAHGMDIPSDMTQDRILPKMDNVDLSNDGSTGDSNKKNRPKVNFSLPSAQKVLEALAAMTNPEDKTIKIGNIEWELMTSTRDFYSDELKALRLETVFIEGDQSQEKVKGTYFYGVEGFISLERSLPLAQSKIIRDTCAITNPGFNQTLIKRQGYVYQKGLDFPPEQELNIVCDQVSKGE